MAQSAPELAEVPDVAAPSTRRWTAGRIVVVGLGILPGVFGVTVFMSGLLLNRVPEAVAIPWSALGLLGLTAALAGAGTAHHLYHKWRGPTRKLRQVLEQISAGKAPMEELNTIGGGLVEVLPAIRQLVHQLRQQRAEIAQLEAEMRQRIASRTDALERTIGTLRQQAARDALTGLYNRRLLDQSLAPLIERCRAGSDTPGLCLLMMDLDHFKVLNDRLGHAAGDGMLRSVGQLIRSTIRENDLAFRCGGDEFVVVMPGSDRAAGEALAQRLSSLVDAAAQTLHVNPATRLSIGLATLDDLPDPQAAALLQKADARLYEVKSHHHSQPARGLRVAG